MAALSRWLRVLVHYESTSRWQRCRAGFWCVPRAAARARLAAAFRAPLVFGLAGAVAPRLGPVDRASSIALVGAAGGSGIGGSGPHKRPRNFGVAVQTRATSMQAWRLGFPVPNAFRIGML